MAKTIDEYFASQNGKSAIDTDAVRSAATAETGAGFSANTYQGMAMGLQAVGSYFDSQTKKEQHKTQEIVHKFNARMAMRQADEKIGRIRRTAQRLRGAQYASIGASGLAFDGNALEVIADSMFEYELDIAAVRKSAIMASVNGSISAGTASANAHAASAAGVLGVANTALEAANYYDTGK